jgi:hypothetical protein
MFQFTSESKGLARVRTRRAREAAQPTDESAPGMTAYRRMMSGVDLYRGRTALRLEKNQSIFNVTLREVQLAARERNRPLKMLRLQDKRRLGMLTAEVQHFPQALLRCGQSATDIGDSEQTGELDAWIVGTTSNRSRNKLRRAAAPGLAAGVYRACEYMTGLDVLQTATYSHPVRIHTLKELLQLLSICHRKPTKS